MLANVKRILRASAVCALAMFALGIGSLPAGATYPGANGKIAFTAPYKGTAQIWTMNENGAGRTRLTGPARANFHPGFTSDGKKMVFIATSEAGVNQIYMMNTDGNLRTRVTTGSRSFGDPAISPDGKWIVAAGWKGTNPKNLWLVRADGTGAKRFTEAPGDDLGPSFSPDGKSVVWTRFREDGTSDILVKNLDGTGAKQLTSGTGDDKGPSYSPDGTKIVFTHMVGNKNTGRLWIMNADGTGRSKRTDNPDGTMFDHAIWSPDGTKIAFIRERDSVHAVADLFVISAAGGGGMTNLTDGRNEPMDFDWGVG